jgi:DNA/RNA endonuclease YhcR with UshA esterase domain
MKMFFVSLLTVFSTTLYAQKEIKLEEVKDHVGDSVKVEGKIFGVKAFSDDDGNTTLVLLNLGADYPNQVLTIAVYPSAKADGVVMPNESFKGDKAIVTGRIELYKGKAQIEVRIPNRLFIAAADPVTVPANQ